MNTKIVNLTPHSVNLILPYGENLEIPSSGLATLANEAALPAVLSPSVLDSPEKK